jgi:hypothetical protein
VRLQLGPADRDWNSRRLAEVPDRLGHRNVGQIQVDHLGHGALDAPTGWGRVDRGPADPTRLQHRYKAQHRRRPRQTQHRKTHRKPPSGVRRHHPEPGRHFRGPAQLLDRRPDGLVLVPAPDHQFTHPLAQVVAQFFLDLGSLTLGQTRERAEQPQPRADRVRPARQIG